MLSRRMFVGGALLASPGCRQSTRKLIAVVPKATSHLFFVSIHRGVDKAKNDFHLDILWNGPDQETEHSRQIQIVESMISRRVDALAISATDERALAGCVQKAISQGIPVTIFDS